jgi:putative transposase
MKEIVSYLSADKNISIRSQCALLGISRSNFYYKHVEESQENLHIMRLMDEYYLKHPTYGVLQMQDYLRSKGLMVNHKRVRRLLRKMGIMAIYPKKNLSKMANAKYVRPYLLNGLKIERPNQLWAIDITYVPMAKGFMYLVAIIDVYSRFVVGWDIFNSLEAENCLLVLKNAIKKYGMPEIINSDQGCQFTSLLWIEYLENEQIKISMDGKGRAIDNIFIERLWRTVKLDYIYITPVENGLELYQGLKEFFGHYNHFKAHQGIDRVTPSSLYFDAA